MRFPRFVNRMSLDDAVRPGEVDIFKNTETPVLRQEGTQAVNAGAVQNDHLARFDIPDELGADDIQRAAFAAKNIAVADFTQHQRTYTQWITDADHHVVGKGDQRIGALDLTQRFHHAVDHRSAAGGRHQMDDNLGVGGRLEQAAPAYQLSAQHQGIGQVAVMGQRETAELEIGEQRLYVPQYRVAAGGVPDVSDRRMALQLGNHRLRAEIVAHLSHGVLNMIVFTIEGDDTRRLLSTVLKGVQPECRNGGSFTMVVNAEHATLFA